MLTPEQQSRLDIDKLLSAAGWQLQDRTSVNLGAAKGVAIREFPLRTGFADYLLFVDRKAVGAIEAKAAGISLSGVEGQSGKYSIGLPESLRAPVKPLPFLYESTGVETFFSNGLDPDPRSRRVFAFHQPQTLSEWINLGQVTLRQKIQTLPALIPDNLWPAQIEAITNLEQSLRLDRPRALIQMATGSGKTFTAINAIYRLLKFGGARRFLFLVDRNNLGRQVYNEFQKFVSPDDGRKFTELYNVQRMTTNALDDVSRVCITTVQRLYSMLVGEPDFDARNEESSLFDMPEFVDAPKLVSYNHRIPIEYFDFIVVDECHRSIYNLWRQVLEYFDAHIIGLTATPSKQTFGFFNQNLVMEYSRQRAVIDGVNVDEQVYTIRTQITRDGSKVEAGLYVDKRNRKTRAMRWEQLDDELTYVPPQLDQQVVAVDQIRTIIRTFRDRLFTEIFPGRREVPKTLVFAKDDSHAEDIVRIIREEFGRGNAFCQKITYRVTGAKPEDLIRDFRNQPLPRIAVTVDMIATGTDIKSLEVLLFMRSVKSRMLFDQMRGRGTRVISSTELQAITPDATEKTRFVIIDTVGVFDTLKVETESLERKRLVSFAKLLESLAFGIYDEDSLSSLAARLTRLGKKLSERDQDTILKASGGKTVHDLAATLLDAIDPDRQFETARTLANGVEPTADQVTEASAELMQAATDLFNPDLRNTLIAIQERNEQVIDQVSKDVVLEAGFGELSTESARSSVQSFRAYIEQHQDEIDALQILFNRPYNQHQLTLEHLKDLADKLKQQPQRWTSESLWTAFALSDSGKVRTAGAKRLLTDLIALVRHAVQPEGELIPYPEQVRSRYQKWLEAQAAQGRIFTAEQRRWLDQIAEHIGINLTFSVNDFDYGEFFDEGGRAAAVGLFGRGVLKLLDELNKVLAA